MAEEYLHCISSFVSPILTHGIVHDVDFRTSEKDFDSFAAALTEKIIEADDTIPQLPVKDIVGSIRVILACTLLIRLAEQKFRIYRDIRFTPDPTPYKVRLMTLPGDFVVHSYSPWTLVLAVLFSGMVSGPSALDDFVLCRLSDQEPIKVSNWEKRPVCWLLRPNPAWTQFRW